MNDPAPHPQSAARAPGEPDRDSLDWPHHAGQVDRVLREIHAKVARRRSRQKRAGLAVATALALAVGLFAWRSSGLRAPAPSAVASAIVSLPDRQTLPDGSIVELRENARITADYSGSHRRIRLEAGEAHFEVAKDPSRPFVVTAGTVEVRAVGTAFLVQLAPGTVEVVVTEGRVAVDLQKTSTLVDAGRRVVVPVEPRASAPTDAPGVGTAAVRSPLQIEPIEGATLSERMAWRVPKLEFTRTPLSEALPMINRYSRIRLVLGDAAAGAVELSGILRADNVEPLFRLLATDYGVVVERRNDGEAVLHKMP